jgi:hypothetical protein
MDWDLKSLVDDPGGARWIEISALDGSQSGRVCLSDETLVTVIRALDPGYPLEVLRMEIDKLRCPPPRGLT